MSLKQEQTDWLNLTENLEIHPNSFGKLVSDQVASQITGDKDRMFNKWYLDKNMANWKKYKIRSIPYTIPK